jgi:hypothetical protein
MAFALRDAVDEDLDQCVTLTTDRFLYEAIDLDALRRMWQHVIATKSGPFMAIVDVESPSHVLFFGLTVFVQDERADAYHRLERPGIARAMVEEFRVGGRPFLSRNEIARANATGGLNMVVVHHGYEERFDESDEKLRAATYEVNLKYLSGWNLRTYTTEVFAKNMVRDGEQMAEANGVCVKCYAEEQLRAANIPEEKAPRLWLARRDDSSKSPAVQLMLFNFYPPRFGFSLEQQDLLLLALDGHADESIARALGTSLSTIKKRFHTIHQRVQAAGFRSSAARPAPSASDHLGVDSRRGLLDYLREHREELRPYSLEGPS